MDRNSTSELDAFDAAGGPFEPDKPFEVVIAPNIGPANGAETSLPRVMGVAAKSKRDALGALDKSLFELRVAGERFPEKVVQLERLGPGRLGPGRRLQYLHPAS